jgi:ubiquinone/menaquinone biosynthesis C-methylase UbiE
MGSNWREYLEEAYRVLRYNGEVIIGEGIDRLETIREAVVSLGFQIIKEEFTDTETEKSRWFYLYAIKK